MGDLSDSEFKSAAGVTQSFLCICEEHSDFQSWFLLHSLNAVPFSSHFVLACTRVQIPAASVCSLHSKHDRSFPCRPRDSERRQIVRAPGGPSRQALLLSQENHFSSKAAPPAERHGWIERGTRARQCIRNGKIELSGCRCADLAQNN